MPAADLEPWSSVSPRAVAQVLTHGEVQGEVPEAAQRWLRHAVETYLDIAESLNTPEDLQPGPAQAWVVAGRRDGMTIAVERQPVGGSL